MKKIQLLAVFILFISFGYAQNIVWTGNAANNDFFDETNWKDSATNLAPIAGTIDPGIAINLNLQILSSAQPIIASGIISLGTGSLAVTSAKITANAISAGSVEINSDAYIELSTINPFQNNVQINFKSGIGWVKTILLNGATIVANHLSQIKVNQIAAAYPSNLRLDNYYLEGTVIRANLTSATPLVIYDNINLQGAMASVAVNTVFSANTIPNTLNNKIESFILKKGFMVTFAIADDGTSKSKNYIASEDDLTINDLPNYLKNNISFIRVVPWNWVTKKGRTDIATDLNSSWVYKWNNSLSSTLDWEYVPMSWGWSGAEVADIPTYTGKYNSTHVLGFNEPDDCSAQSGQYTTGIGIKLCDTDAAVYYYKNLMKTGMRLVSPACREEGATGWLKEFYDKATIQDIRIDVIAVHWYDWGSNPAGTPNATASSIFNRFKNYLTKVHDLYGLPIWITEFNANPARSNATNAAFLALALPYLEGLDYVERYNWFPYNTGTDYYSPLGSTTLSDVGTFYKNQVSTKSITGTTITADSNLDKYYKIIDPTGSNLLINGFFETGDITGWSGTNIDIITPPYQGTTAGRILSGAGEIYQNVVVDPLGIYNLSFYTKWFAAPSAPISVQILDTSTSAVIVSQLMTTSTAWNFVSLSFTVPAGVTSIKVYVGKGGADPGWFIDNAVLSKTGTSLSVNNFETKYFSIYPNPSSGIFNLIGEKQIESYSIYTIQGQLIKQEMNLNTLETSIDLFGQTKGIYYIKITDINGIQSIKKIILN